MILILFTSLNSCDLLLSMIYRLCASQFEGISLSEAEFEVFKADWIKVGDAISASFLVLICVYSS